MGDTYNIIRDVGRSISGAITAGPEMRLRAAQTKQAMEEQKEAKDLRVRAQEEEAKRQAARKRAGEIMGEGRMDDPELYKSLLESGEPVSSLAALRKANRPPKEPKGPDHYAEEFEASKIYAFKINQELGDEASKIAEKQAAGEDTTADMEAYTAKYNAKKEMLGKYITDFEYKVKTTYANQVSEMSDKIFTQWDPKRIDALTTTMKGALDRMGGDVSKMMDELDNNIDAIAPGVDLSGIPSNADLRKAAMAVRVKYLDEDSVLKLMNEKDPKKLQEIINDDDAPKEIKLFVTAILKKNVVSQGLQEAKAKKATSKGKKKIQKFNEFLEYGPK